MKVGNISKNKKTEFKIKMKEMINEVSKERKKKLDQGRKEGNF